ncbi:MAG: PfkB family carbohydrate kinase [Defluviitaleaceae bacterium]|nr:PfkB family carbohydrate kinase [Defluviitaleaceae bacterium]MCL2836241.1 PfkB family carbohydrate kinase [Defluviitaleaceae bacterium]
MNIRELAKIANVSPTTISKVINHKANDISEVTKKRIWDVVREYNYVPYQNVINSLEANGRLIGMLVSDIDAMHAQIIKGAEKAAFENDFEIVICKIGEQASMLENRLNSLRRKKAEGVILSRTKSFGLEILESLARENYPVRILEYYVSYHTAVHQAYKELIDKGHKKIGLITSDLKRTDTQKKLDAYKNAVLKENRSYDISLVYETDGTSESSGLGMKYLLSMDVSAVLAFDDVIASGIYHLLQKEALRVPQDISVLCFGGYGVYPYLFPEPAVIKTAYDEIGYRAVLDLIHEASGSSPPNAGGAIEATVYWGAGIAACHTGQGKSGGKILVIGYLNMDTIIYTPGEADGRNNADINASDVQIMPGGKASLQSATVARLGGNCYVLGRVGSDLNGEKIQNELSKMNIKTGGIIFDENNPTGKAIIYVPKTGKTSFDIEPGANVYLSGRDIERYIDLFSDAAFCLIPTEVPRDIFYYAARICKQKSVKLISSINPAFELDANPIGAYVLISSLLNIDILVPGRGSLQKKVNKLLEHHCENIIITLEDEGQCILIHKKQWTRFVAADFVFMSHTAGIDCFCGALAVALTEGKTLPEATRYALTGAILTMSRKGSLPAIPTAEEIIENLDRISEKEYCQVH